MSLSIQISPAPTVAIDALLDNVCRYDRLLRELAISVLGGPDGVETVLDNCRRYAVLCAPAFESEGAFRTWLFHLVLDEARGVLRARMFDEEEWNERSGLELEAR